MNINRIDLTAKGRRYVGYQLVHENGTYTESTTVIDPGETMSEGRWALHLANLVEALGRHYAEQG